MKKNYSILFVVLYLFANNIYAQQFTKLLDFNNVGVNAIPNAELISDDTCLYGTSFPVVSGTTGNLFKFKFDGSGYSNLHTFGDTLASAPNGSLVSDGIYLYGITNASGTNEKGVIYRIKPDGTDFTRLFVFNGLNGGFNAIEWTGHLVLEGDTLYGTTYGGGNTFNQGYIGSGVIFKMKKDGTGYTKLFDFGGTNGIYPVGTLLSVGNNLFGVTVNGGSSYNPQSFIGSGVLFRINKDGTGYTKLIDFVHTNGSDPNGSLVSDGTYLYGTTWGGGTNLIPQGLVFKVKMDGTNFSKLLEFDLTNGSHPSGGLVLINSYLYGTTHEGGSGGGPYGSGVLFRVKTDGTVYKNLFNFNNVSGRLPNAPLFFHDYSFYGTTREGGIGNKGTLFRYNLKGTSSISKAICEGDSINFSGQTLRQEGTFKDTLINSLSYDSIVTLTLTINSLPMPTIIKTGNILSTQAYTTYQWFRNNLPINGATSQNFTATLSGVYSVQVIDVNGCQATSEGDSVVVSGIQNLTNETISIYPNPVKDVLNVAIGTLSANKTEILLYDIDGKLLKELIATESISVLNISELAKGAYLIEIREGKMCERKRFVKM